jgi:glycosyltransferase involved in cell wall biosynthesis
MNVLHVCWDLGQGGIQRYLIDLLTAHKKTFRSSLMVLSSPGALSAEAAELCNRVDYIGMKNGLYMCAFVPILKVLRTGDHDIIHSHSNNILFNIALKFQSKPVIYTEHGGSFLNKELGSLLLYKYVHSNIHRFVAISQYMANLMCQRNSAIGDRICVIHNGVDYDYIAYSGLREEVQLARYDLPEGLKVGFIGRLTLDKGIDLFIETAKRINLSNPTVNFIVIGDGPAREDMQALVREYNMEQRVFFLGYRKDARELIGALDICLFTSRYDAFGLVLIESLASSVPVVAMAENSAVPEILRDGIDGLIVEGLSPDNAAACVNQLLSDPVLRKKMAEAGKERVKREFTIENNAQRVAQEYLKLIADRTGG